MIFGKKIPKMVTHCTQLVFVIAILTLCVRSVENIELCQKMTIKNCASNFHEVESNKRTTIFCMSIFPYINVLDLFDPV